MDRIWLGLAWNRVRIGPFAGGLAALALLLGAAPQAWAQVNNPLPARVLRMFDIDNDGQADQSIDSDGDGLPDNWEVGGLDIGDTDVPFSAPTAIVPGSPPTTIFNRRAVRTRADSADTDGDGLSDFIEVFGLKFIDDNGNGILDDATARDGNGNPIFDSNGVAVRRTDANGNPIGEWFDFNADGMPSIGEYPARNELQAGGTADFDGFIFTDPTVADTDGDGINDRQDRDPLVNPRAFGQASAFFGLNLGEQDGDNDGLGDGMDLGNDNSRIVDNPNDLIRVIQLFRGDLFDVFGQQVRVPEALIEDLLQADWNGDGLFGLTDTRNARFGFVPGVNDAQNPVRRSEQAIDDGLYPWAVGTTDLFRIPDPDDPDEQVVLGFAETAFPTAFNRFTYFDFENRGPGNVKPPLPLQEQLLPSRAQENIFLPDARVWTVLYAWRMPGFDIDGNGFIGFDGGSVRDQTITVNGNANFDSDAQNAPSTEILVSQTTGIGGLDGQIDVDLPEGCGMGACGALNASTLALTLAGIVGMRGRRRR